MRSNGSSTVIYPTDYRSKTFIAELISLLFVALLPNRVLGFALCTISIKEKLCVSILEREEAVYFARSTRARVSIE